MIQMEEDFNKLRINIRFMKWLLCNQINSMCYIYVLTKFTLLGLVTS
jgi:hypothetical protein